MQSAGDQKTPRPRKRVTKACNGCRIKRTRCDGNRSQCSACVYRQEPCVYTQAQSKRSRPSNAYIQALEERVVHLESRLELLEKPAERINAAAFNGQNENSSVSPQPQTTGHEGVTNEDPVDDLVEALGCFTLGDTGELRFFGASSNFNIIHNPSLKVPSSIRARSCGIMAARQMPGFVEPSIVLRDHLLGIFWKWQNSWQYIVPREAFVHDLYVSKTGRHCTPLLLSAIFALSSRYSSRPELRSDSDDANTAGADFAAQARTMLHYEYEAPTTSTVQATALLGLYWAAIDNEGLGFMYIGMACRMVMNLGLHLDCTVYISKGIVSEEDVQCRNITFWGVYILDKLFCLGMGRPASIQEYHITTPQPKAEDRTITDLPDEVARCSMPFPTSHITETITHVSELLILTSGVIDQLYSQRSSWTDQEREDIVMRTYIRAVRFFDELPKALKISESSLQPSAPYVYQLHLQYYHAIILLHRPFFKSLSRGRTTGDYDPQGRCLHSRACKNAAEKTCSIIRIYAKAFTNRNMPISAVHPVFSAAIVHLLDLRFTDQGPVKEKGLYNLQLCIRSLYEMNLNWEWANRSLRAIQLLALEWGVDIWTAKLRREVGAENLRKFEKYNSGSSPFDLLADDSQYHHDQPVSQTFDELFDAWVEEDSFLGIYFNLRDGL